MHVIQTRIQPPQLSYKGEKKKIEATWIFVEDIIAVCRGINKIKNKKSKNKRLKGEGI